MNPGHSQMIYVWSLNTIKQNILQKNQLDKYEHLL